MPAISFQEEWIDKLLSGTKQQTTRAHTSRIKVGDVCSIYNQQRRRIIDKQLRKLTCAGIDTMYERGYPMISEFHEARYHAHFLGKAKITEVYDIHPSVMAGEELEAWARMDGFDNFALARWWFEIRDGVRWMNKTWTVIRWNGWLERYFEPE